MILYCFYCPSCGYGVETPVHDPAPVHETAFPQVVLQHTPVVMMRDYRAEAVGIGPGVRVE